MGIRILPKVGIPLVGVELSEVTLPDFPPKRPKLEKGDMTLLRYGLMDDVADFVPVVGDVGADLAYAEIVKRMSPDQYNRFLQDNKWLPSSLAILKGIAEKG